MTLGELSLCGGVGLAENMGIVADPGILEETESLNHGPVESEADVNADSLPNVESFSRELPDEGVDDGMEWFGVSGKVVWMFETRSEDERFEETACGNSFEVLYVQSASTLCFTYTVNIPWCWFDRRTVRCEWLG